MYLSCHWWTHCQFSQFKNWLVLSPVHLWGRPSGEYVYGRQVPPLRQECTLGSSSATSGSTCPPRCQIGNFQSFLVSSQKVYFMVNFVCLPCPWVSGGPDPHQWGTSCVYSTEVHRGKCPCGKPAQFLSFARYIQTLNNHSVISDILWSVGFFCKLFIFWWVVTFFSQCWDPENFHGSMFSK